MKRGNEDLRQSFHCDEDDNQNEECTVSTVKVKIVYSTAEISYNKSAEFKSK